MQKNYKTKANKEKKRVVEELRHLIKEYPVIAVVNLENLPALQLLKIKNKLHDKIVIKVPKKRLIKIALDGLKDEKKHIENLKDRLKGIPALIFTKEDPFMLCKLLDNNKSPSVAKTGQTAPNDIVIPAGPTNFPPGPMIGELGQMGIKTKVENGKVCVIADKVIVKEGEVIIQKVAALLANMGIEPMEVGLNLTVTYQNGEILEKSVLSIDEEEYIANILRAANDSQTLAVEVGYIVSENVNIFITKASREANSVNHACKNMDADKSASEHNLGGN